MDSFETTPKQWGNSLGITIPNDIVKKRKITAKSKIKILVFQDNHDDIRSLFGTLKGKKPTQEVLDAIDREFE